jgi:hemerythrin-like domain-containing protein
MVSLSDAQRNDLPTSAPHEMETLPAAFVKRVHGEKLRMCDVLEEIADSLPDNVDRLKCIGVASALLPLLRGAHRYEEEVLFPVYEAASSRWFEEPSSIDRLRAEHLEDECFADEVTEVLMAIGHGEVIDNPEAVGFMLRGLFETMRRHIAFETEHVLAIVERAGW